MEDLRLESLWGQKLRELVESVYRPKGMHNSLPFLVKKNDEYQIRWFYYELIRKQNTCYLCVRRIITLDSKGRCSIVSDPIMNIEWNLQTTDVKPPDLDFYNEFVNIFKKGEYKKTIDLLVEFEATDAIDLYDELSHRYL